MKTLPLLDFIHLKGSTTDLPKKKKDILNFVNYTILGCSSRILIKTVTLLVMQMKILTSSKKCFLFPGGICLFTWEVQLPPTHFLLPNKDFVK